MKIHSIIFLILATYVSYTLSSDLSSTLTPEFASWLDSSGYEIFHLDRPETITVESETISDSGFLPVTPPKSGPAPYLTSHFTSWLQAHNYSSFGFERSDISGGSFGGKADDNDAVVNQPVIFIHGNGDHAMGAPLDEFNGWIDSITYFMSQGYKESELYATTWGPADPLLVSQQYHSYEYLNYLRNFIEAVLKYTGAEKVDIISHSMGVTLGRKAIKGGAGTDGQPYDLGSSLAQYVDTFLGIAGGNWGLTACVSTPELPTCGMKNGFYPGYAIGPLGLSEFLEDLNTEGGKEGDYVFSMLSLADDVILYGDIVYGKYTSKIPDSDGTKIYATLGHMMLKDDTCAEQFNIVTKHQI